MKFANKSVTLFDVVCKQVCNIVEWSLHTSLRHCSMEYANKSVTLFDGVCKQVCEIVRWSMQTSLWHCSMEYANKSATLFDGVCKQVCDIVRWSLQTSLWHCSMVFQKMLFICSQICMARLQKGLTVPSSFFFSFSTYSLHGNKNLFLKCLCELDFVRLQTTQTCEVFPTKV